MYRQIWYLYMVWYQGTARSGFYGIRETQLRYLVVSRYSMIWFLLYKRDLVTVSCGIIACHADVLRGSSHVPAPWTSADLSGKNVDQSQQTSRSGKCTLDLEKFRAWLNSAMKGEDLTVLKQTTQLTHKRSYWWLPSQSRWKKLPRRLNLLNGSRLYYKTITCEKKFCLLFSLTR